MSQLIRHLTSLRSLTRSNASGQIATLLILLLLIILMFVLVTVNIGNVSVNATKLSNAADTASLQLASQLATKARMIWQALGDCGENPAPNCPGKVEKCQKKNIWSMIIGLVAAVIVTIITWGMAWYVILIAVTAAGTVGGIIGAAISGTSIAQGALTGFVIGLAVATIAIGLGGATTTVPGHFGASTYTASGLAETVWIPTTTIAMEASTSSVVLGGLGLASQVFTDVMKYRGVSAVLEQLSRDMAKLSERDRFRETSFLAALSQAVDDPNKVRDEDDIDGDGDRNELLPNFYVWWHKRMVNFASISDQFLGPVENFLSAMQNFVNFAEKTYDSGTSTPGILERQDYKWVWEPYGTDDLIENAVSGENVKDGVIVNLLRTLYLAHPTRDITTHWEEGPSPAAMNSWKDIDCCSGLESSCSGPICPPPPPGFDDLDDLADDLRGRTFFMKQLLEMNGAASAWETWISFFFDFEALTPGFEGTPDTENYYYYLGNQIEMLQSLKSEIIDIRDNRLEPCRVGCLDEYNNCMFPCPEGAGHWEPWWLFLVWVPGGDCLVSPPTPPYPCHLSSGGGTIDNNLTDDFQPALDAIDTLINQFSNFRSAMDTLSSNMLAILNSASYQYGGYNPIIYQWDDARGHTTVQVTAGPFRMAATKTSSSWTKTCVRLVNYTDADNCWIRVTRFEPGGDQVPVGPLGNWNPFNRGITKISKAYYSFDKVGIKATSR